MLIFLDLFSRYLFTFQV